MIFAIFWVITQRTVLIPYRRFGKKPIGPIFLNLEDGIDSLSLNVGTE